MAVNSNDSGKKKEGEFEYESDLEDSKMSVNTRRREASDDEEDAERLQRGGEKGNNRPPSRLNDVSDVESVGAVAEYYDAFGEDEDYAEESELEEEEYEEDEYDEEYSEEDGVGRDGDVLVKEDVNNSVADGKDENSRDGGGGEERKEAVVEEPFSVPTAGAFYMHDNRFRGYARRGKHRRPIGGRRLQESKDDYKWGHDKFEEVTANERRRVEHRRGSRGRSRGRGRAQGNHDREIAKNVSQTTKNDVAMIVKGRGPRRYQPSFENKYKAPIPRNKQYRQSDKPSRASSVSSSKPVYNAAPTNAGPERKQAVSGLNVASPPFYPTSSSKDNTSSLKQREVPRDGVMMTGRPQLSVQMPQPTSRNSFRPQLRGRGRGRTSSSHMAYQPAASNSLVDRVPPAGQLQNFLPLMQFGGQHPRGIGVPAVGMAFPGYVGRGNSEMTWLPVLAGGPGALGSPYCPPYINVDGSYNTRPSGQTSSAVSNASIDNSAAKVGGDVVPAQRNDRVREDLGQRKKNTRRYTEMKFSK